MLTTPKKKTNYGEMMIATSLAIFGVACIMASLISEYSCLSFPGIAMTVVGTICVADVVDNRSDDNGTRQV